MYIGRFAPSPTGPLHFGSLVAAVASYCDAKSQQGKWLVRMEDLDKPREIPGAASTILQQLEAFGFTWDDQVVYQSQREDLYEAALQSLKQNKLIYPCSCSRKEILDSATASGIEGVIYPKTCLLHPPKPDKNLAFRIITTEKILRFTDEIQGHISQNIACDIGDFILKRADGLFAYQLAVVVDDDAQHITHVVRGADLLTSTSRQIYLQQQLNLPTPHYAHVPLVCNTSGEKLSKQTLAKPIDAKSAVPLLITALGFLGQQPPADLAHHTLTNIWDWAIKHWQISSVPKNNNTKVECSF
jgi:glutamyl-Q tRNA(Asp) synthetase